jgi:hypothetical protein
MTIFIQVPNINGQEGSTHLPIHLATKSQVRTHCSSLPADELLEMLVECVEYCQKIRMERNEAQRQQAKAERTAQRTAEWAKLQTGSRVPILLEDLDEEEVTEPMRQDLGRSGRVKV